MKEKKKLSFVVPTADNSNEFIIAATTTNEFVKSIDIKKIKPFPNHPFSVSDNDEMSKLVESIKDHGVQEPIIVRQKDDCYELLSGHRRTRAATIAGLNTVPAIVKLMTDDEATIYMVDANLHRENILPSEKAKAYKMKMEALRHQGKKTNSKDTMSQSESWSANQIAQESGESSRQVYRYVRLSNLIDRFLEMIDNSAKKIKPNPIDNVYSMPMNVGLILADISVANQYLLFDCICETETVPNRSQAMLLQKMDNDFNKEIVYTVLIGQCNKQPCDTVSAVAVGELRQLRNKQERENFINNYEKWGRGIWKEIPELNLKFYRYEFPTGTQFIVMTYQITGNHFYTGDHICTKYRLVLSPNDNYDDKYGEYGYYDPTGNGRSPLIDYLTKTKAKVQFKEDKK